MSQAKIKLTSKERIFYALKPYKTFGFYFKWKFMPVEGARRSGVRLQIIRETGKGYLGPGYRLTHVAKRQQRKIIGTQEKSKDL